MFTSGKLGSLDIATLVQQGCKRIGFVLYVHTRCTKVAIYLSDEGSHRFLLCAPGGGGYDESVYDD